jgi:hypothetical protein
MPGFVSLIKEAIPIFGDVLSSLHIELCYRPFLFSQRIYDFSFALKASCEESTWILLTYLVATFIKFAEKRPSDLPLSLYIAL